MNKPTKEQIQWFWEQCGAKQVRLEIPPDPLHNPFTHPPSEHRDALVFAGGIIADDLPIDLNNLFKYAVPKLDGIDIQFSKYDNTGWFIRLEDQVVTTEDEDPALALFWAIYKAFGGKE